MKFDPADIFTTEPMNGATINGWIFIPPEFVITVYLIIGVAVVLATSLYLRRGLSLTIALRKACLAAFFCSGLACLVYSERTWYRWLINDLNIYRGHTSEEKTGIFGGPFYKFITIARDYLPDNDYVVYSSDTYSKLQAQYYLLPKRNRSDARYVLVISDNDISYDAGTGTLREGDTIIGTADMVFFYDSRTFILRKR